MFRCALISKSGTRGGFDPALQNEPRKAYHRLIYFVAGHRKFVARIKRRIQFSEAKAAAGDFPQTPPFAWHDLENFPQALLRDLIPLLSHRAGVSVVYFRAPVFKLSL